LRHGDEHPRFILDRAAEKGSVSLSDLCVSGPHGQSRFLHWRWRTNSFPAKDCMSWDSFRAMREMKRTRTVALFSERGLSSIQRLCALVCRMRTREGGMRRRIRHDLGAIHAELHRHSRGQGEMKTAFNADGDRHRGLWPLRCPIKRVDIRFFPNSGCASEARANVSSEWQKSRSRVGGWGEGGGGGCGGGVGVLGGGGWGWGGGGGGGGGVGGGCWGGGGGGWGGCQAADEDTVTLAWLAAEAALLTLRATRDSIESVARRASITRSSPRRYRRRMPLGYRAGYFHGCSPIRLKGAAGGFAYGRDVSRNGRLCDCRGRGCPAKPPVSR